MLSGVGFGTLPQSGLPGEVPGRLRGHSSWKPIEQATMSYGHGISVSLLQLARAYTIFTSDGELMPVTVLQRDAPPDARARGDAGSGARGAPHARDGGAAGRHGAASAGHRAIASPARPAPRTSSKNGGYASDKYVSSFVGFAPASDPRLIVAVMIDEPRAGAYYGGAVAAPVFSSVMAGALRLLAVPSGCPGDARLAASTRRKSGRKCESRAATPNCPAPARSRDTGRARACA